ncbi:MAG: hypothetical protein ACTSX1_09735 [Candidatus Heimdallarchaeaceae archaeon]
MLRNGGIGLDRENYWKGRSEAVEIESYINVCLVPGDIICPKCGGKGIYPVELDDIRERCDKCWREGKLDWIEVAMGKPDPYAGLSTSCSSSSISPTTYSDPEDQNPFEKHLQDYVDKMSNDLQDYIDKDILGMFKYVFGTKYKKEKEVHF